MENDKVAKRIQEKRKKIEAHNRKQEELKQQFQQTRVDYQNNRENPVVKDILTKAQKFMAYHVKLAQDGVGARKTGHLLENNTEEVENYFLTPADRVSHLDKAAGIQELLDYINRQLETAVPTPEKPEEGETEGESAVEDVAEDGSIEQPKAA